MSNEDIQWSDEYTTGINAIDSQHEDIIKSVNALYKALEENAGKETIIELIEKLDNYTTKHFDTEEKYMKIYNYPEYAAQVRAHEFFKTIYNEIRYHSHYLTGDKYMHVYQFALHLNQILIDWLRIHLETLDKVFAAFLKDKLTQ